VSASNLPARGGGGFAFTAFAAPAWLVICAVLALGILGIVSFNPRAPAIGSRMHGLAVAALFLIAFVRLASPAAFDAFCPAAECSWPFLSLLVVLGFDAGGRLLRKTRS
jgi:hypothetical protein